MRVLRTILLRIFGRPATGGATAGGAGAAVRAEGPPGDGALSAAPAWWEAPAANCVAAPADQGRSAAAIDRVLYDRLIAVLDQPDLELPRLPDAAHEALAQLREDCPDLRRAAEITSRDPVLAGAILRMANSAAYRGVREIDRLDLAFARLGQRAARTVLFSATLRDLTIRVGAPQRTLGEELWRSAWASGVILSHLGPRFGLPEDRAFLVGLMHDIGKLAILSVVCTYQRRGGESVTRPTFEALCEQWHEHIGLRLAEAWNLPPPLPEIIGGHHHAPASDDPLGAARNLVQLADACCRLLGYAAGPRPALLSLPCARALELGDNAPTRRLLAPLPELISTRMAATGPAV